jgi:hypothetical protein
VCLVQLCCRIPAHEPHGDQQCDRNTLFDKHLSSSGFQKPISASSELPRFVELNLSRSHIRLSYLCFQLTVKVAVLVPVFAFAETFTVVFAPTALVTMVKLARLLPAVTVTFAGMEATAPAPLTTVRLTTVFWLSGAGNPTVPVVLFPPVTLLGTKPSDVGIIGLTVKLPVFFEPFAVAENWTLVDTVTWFV